MRLPTGYDLDMAALVTGLLRNLQLLREDQIRQRDNQQSDKPTTTALWNEHEWQI